MILVTGGGGYLGGRIVKYLIQEGLSARIGHRDIFNDLGSLKNACRNVTTIIHLAAMNAQECQNDPKAALLVNGLNTLNLLSAAEQEGVLKFIYFSTAHVYGSPLVGVVHESTLPRPSHSYSITHRLAEDYVLEATQNGNINGVIFRLSNAVGSPVSFDTNCWMLVVNDLCKQVVLEQQIKLRSDPSIQRDYIPISTVCDCIKFVLDHDSLDGEIVNISSGISHSLLDITKFIADRAFKVLGIRASIDFSSVLDNTVMDHMYLDVKNEKLIKTGCRVYVDLTNEIDKLLLNCQRWFVD